MFSVDANPPYGQQGASGLHRSVTFTLFNTNYRYPVVFSIFIFIFRCCYAAILIKTHNKINLCMCLHLVRV